METKKFVTIWVFAFVVVVCWVQVGLGEPMGTAFTYQGRLMDKNKPADGLYSFQFKLYDSNDPCTGTPLGSPIDVNDLDVIDGHFVVELDFGIGIFDGNAVWLETRVVVSPMGSDPATLDPLLELTPTPYALHTYGLTVVGDNTFIGKDAGINNTGGNDNTFSGYRAGYYNKLGDYNTFLGSHAGYYNTGGDNSFLGSHAGYYNTGYNNTFLGNSAGYYTTGSYNTFSGYRAGYYNKEGSYNTFLGHYAGYSNTEGYGNTFLGNNAGYRNTGSRNVFIGYRAGLHETGSNKLYVANSDTSVPLIYGDFSTGRVGIGTTNPQRRLHIDSDGKADPVIIANGKANTETANNLLNSLPNSTLIIGGPWSDKIYFYWKDESGNKYYIALPGTSL